MIDWCTFKISSLPTGQKYIPLPPPMYLCCVRLLILQIQHPLPFLPVSTLALCGRSHASHVWAVRAFHSPGPSDLLVQQLTRDPCQTNYENSALGPSFGRAVTNRGEPAWEWSPYGGEKNWELGRARPSTTRVLVRVYLELCLSLDFFLSCKLIISSF